MRGSRVVGIARASRSRVRKLPVCGTSSEGKGPSSGGILDKTIDVGRMLIEYTSDGGLPHVVRAMHRARAGARVPPARVAGPVEMVLL